MTPSCLKQIAQIHSLQEEAYNANFIRNEEKATNQDTIKDVQDTQSNLTQTIPILTKFSAKDSKGNDLTQPSLFSEVHSKWTRATSPLSRGQLKSKGHGKFVDSLLCRFGDD